MYEDVKAAGIKLRQIFSEMFPRSEMSQCDSIKHANTKTPDAAGNFSATTGNIHSSRRHSETQIFTHLFLCNEVINVVIKSTRYTLLLKKKAKSQRIKLKLSG